MSIFFSQLTTCYCFYVYKLFSRILSSKKESIDSGIIFYTGSVSAEIFEPHGFLFLIKTE